MSFSYKDRSALMAKCTEISRTTVSRRLVHDFGLKANKPARKPCLTPAMKNKRLAFAKKHATWTKKQRSQDCFWTNQPCSRSLPGSVTSVDPSARGLIKKYTMQTIQQPPCAIIWWGMLVSETAGLSFLAVEQP